MSGWIKISRDINKHWLWGDAARFQCWIDLLLMAAFEDKKVMDDGHLFTLKRGDMLASVSFLSQRWGKSAPTIIKFLKVLESEGMITRKVLYRQTSIITICNYERYQSTDSDTLYTQVNTQLNTQVNSIVYTNKEYKEVKKEKNKKISTNVDTKKIMSDEEKTFMEGMKNHYPRISAMKEPLTLDQYNKLLASYTKEKIVDILGRMENWQSIKKNNVSTYRTALNWLNRG